MLNRADTVGDRMYIEQTSRWIYLALSQIRSHRGRMKWQNRSGKQTSWQELQESDELGRLSLLMTQAPPPRTQVHDTGTGIACPESDRFDSSKTLVIA